MKIVKNSKVILIALIVLTFAIFTGCAKTYEQWELPISINSTEQEVMDIFGYPEDEDSLYSNKTTYIYKTKGISTVLDIDKKVSEIVFKGNLELENLEGWSTYEGKILNGIDLTMDIKQIIDKLGKDYELEEENGMGGYIWNMDGFDVTVIAWLGGAEESEIAYPKNSVLFILIERTLTESDKKYGEDLIREFYSKYNVLHKNELYGKELYLNDEPIGDFGTSNIFSYGVNGNYYHMKDSSINDLICNGETLTQIESYSKLNEWCVYYEDSEYVATQQPYIITEDFVLYTKCLKAEYFSTVNMNACSQLGLFMNDKQIGVLESELNYLNEKIPAGYFEQFRLADGNIIYDRNGDEFVIYDIESKLGVVPGSLFEDINYVDMDAGNGEFAHVQNDSYWANNTWNNDYKLHYKDEIYEDVHSFRLIGDDLYYTKRFLEKKLKYQNIYKVSLIKNNLKIADFYIEDSDIMEYDPFFIKKAPYCLPKSEICIYDDQNFIVQGIEYEPYKENKYDIYRNLILVNGKKVLSNIIDTPFYFYPVIEEKVIKYLLIGDTFGGNYYIRKFGENLDFKLYEGDYPMIVYKK